MLHAIRRTVLACATITAALALLAGIAWGTTEVSFEPSGFIEFDSVAKLTFEAEGVNIECGMTFDGRVRRGPIRIAGGQIGEILPIETRAGECEGGEVERFLSAEGWTITGSRLLTGAGTLPENITGMLYVINGVKIRFAIFFGVARCLYQGNLGLLTALSRVGVGRYRTSGFAAILETSVFRKVGEAVGCPESGRARGTFFFLPTQTVTAR